MSKKLVGFDRNWQPQSFIDSSALPKAPSRFGMLSPYNPDRNAAIWSGGNPYKNGLGQSTGYARAIDAYNTALSPGIKNTNKGLGINYLTTEPGNYADARLWSTGNRGLTGLHVRAPLPTGEMVSVPAEMATRNGQIASPEEMAYALRNAQLVQGGFGPLEGLLGVALAGAGFSGLFGGMLSKLPQGLQNAIKIGGGLDKIRNLIQSKGRSSPGLFFDILGNGFTPNKLTGSTGILYSP